MGCHYNIYLTEHLNIDDIVDEFARTSEAHRAYECMMM